MFPGTLSKPAEKVLATLGKSDILASAYLAGGSALAIQLGHRRSYDFDFYTRSPLQAEDVAAQLAKIGTFRTTLLLPPHTLLGVFGGVKLSIFRYDYPLVGTPVPFLGVMMAPVEDIAAMKLSAITGRATKRDYVDLYAIARKYPLEKQLQWYKMKFRVLGNNFYTIIKALGYLEDAETDDMPKMLIPVSWEKVKRFFISESMRLARKYI